MSQSLAAPTRDIPLVLMGSDRPVVPMQVLRFLQAPEPRTLVVEGHPGAGKTTFALSILPSVDRPTFYVSTRVGRGDLLKQFPWLLGVLDPKKMVDLEEIRPPPGDFQERLIRAMDRLLERGDDAGAPRRLQEFLNFPDHVAAGLFRSPSRDPRSAPLLVIDSWEGLVDPYVHLIGLDEVGRRVLEDSLLTLLHDSGLSTVTVMETDRHTHMDYLADGVVELKAEAREGQVARHLEMRKLRGIPLSRTTRAFSLAEGRFIDCAVGHDLEDPAAAPFVVSTRPNPAHALEFGFPVLDRALGPTPEGSVLLIEIDDSCDPRLAAGIFLPLWARALRDGWELHALTNLSVSPELFRQALLRLTDASIVERRLTNLLEGPGTSVDTFLDRLKAAMGPRSLVSLSLNTFHFLCDGDDDLLVKRLGELTLRAQATGGSLVLTCDPQASYIRRLRYLANRTLVLRPYHGTVLLECRAPGSGALAMALEPGIPGKPPSLRFLPMT